MRFTTSTSFQSKYTSDKEDSRERRATMSDVLTAKMTQQPDAESEWTTVISKRKQPKKSHATGKMRLTPKKASTKMTAHKTPSFPSLGHTTKTTSVCDAPKKPVLKGWAKALARKQDDVVAEVVSEHDAMAKEIAELKAQLEEAKRRTPKVDVVKETKVVRTPYADFDETVNWGDLVDEEYGL